MKDDPRAVTVEYDPESAVYRAKHDFTAPFALTATLVLAVEAVARTEGDDLTAVLFDAVDPDALSGIFEPTGRAERNVGRVTFSMGTYEVTVNADGRIVIDPSDDVRESCWVEPTLERWPHRGPAPLDDAWYAWTGKRRDED